MNASRTPVAIGEVVGGRYKVESFLGDGGMAVVYQARHTGTGKVCALKIIHPHLITRRALVDLFIREAQVGARIGQNPHVVDVFDAGADDARGVPFFAMELLQGQNLERYLKERGAMPPPLVRQLFEQLADALDQAHRAGVVHRDIKPSNLFLTSDHKGQPLLKVVDFGIAKVLEGDPQLAATQIGTPAYAAPEQMGAGFQPVAQKQGILIATGVSPATDVWAMGLVAYEMLTGLPSGQYWGAVTAAELPLKVVLEPQVAPTIRAGDRATLLPPGFDAWFARCTRKNADERWPTAGQATTELAKLLTPGAAEPLGATAMAPYTPAGPPTPAPGPGPMTPPGMGGPPMQPSGPPLQPAYGSYGPSPVQPYAMAPAISAYGQPAAPRAKSGSSGCLVVGLLVGGVGLVMMVGLAIFGVRRFQLTASASACEKEGKRCEEACDRSDLASCARYGLQHERGTGAPLDPARAAELYQKACDGDDPLGCALLGHLHLRGRGGKLRDPTEAKRLLEPACDKGAQLGCALLGELYRDALGGLARDDARARSLFQGACDAGELVGCKDLAGFYSSGRGGLSKDLDRAGALNKRACDGGNPTACNNLGYMFGTGTGFAKDLTRAAALYQQACDGGEPLGCDNLGRFFHHGTSVAKDEARAVALYKQACEGGEARGCTDWGFMHEVGKGGVPKDEARAVELYKQACDAGDPAGCADLGMMTENGRGTAKDETRAAALYKKGCDGGNAAACTNLGVLTEFGKGGLAKNEAEAGSLYKAGCDGGSPSGCTNYGFLLDNGHGVAKDASAATTFYQQACDKDYPRGCANLGWHYLKGIGALQDRSRGIALLKKACNAEYPWACERLKESGAGGLR